MTLDYPLPNVSFDLQGEVALVTGASSGLGWRFARVLAAAGASVAVAARRIDKLDDLCRQIEEDGGAATPVALDVTDTESLLNSVDAAENAFGTVTILVNNAGIPDAQRAHKMPIDLIDRVLDTNLRGPYILSCEVARRLIAAQRPGRIVNISSVGAHHYAGGAAALYSITKAGMARMAEVLAVEWARYGINVNAIAPGAFTLGDDGRHGRARRRRDQALPAEAHGRPRPARQHAPLPRLPRVRVRDRHGRHRRRRTRTAVSH